MAEITFIPGWRAPQKEGGFLDLCVQVCDDNQLQTGAFKSLASVSLVPFGFIAVQTQNKNPHPKALK